MRRARFLAFLATGVVLAGDDVPARAMEDATDPAATSTPSVAAAESDERTWSFFASVYTYLLPGESDYAQPTLAADRDWLHLEARYNYENLRTGSAWVGYNSSFGEELALNLTPMIGGVFGDTNGIAPGYNAALGWRNLELSSESEFVFDTGDSSDSFLYTWSELAWAPVDWFRFGMAAQRTKAYKTEFDVQRGFLVGFAYKSASLTTYVFDPDASSPTVVLGLDLSF